MVTVIHLKLIWLMLLIILSAGSVLASLILAHKLRLLNTASKKTTKRKKLTYRDLLAADLHLAIERDEFFLVYQPKVCAQTEVLFGAEALIRWRHPERGIIAPDVFIPLAESIGMIMVMGDWVIEAAGADLQRLYADGFGNLSIAVNISAAQFSTGDVVGVIAKVLSETKLPAHVFEVELTESMVMHNPEKSIVMLQVLKSMGVKIALDDFGTGHSSLSYLKILPVDILKIDQSFIKGMEHNDHNHAIVSTVISMAKKMGLKVIAEGVENEAEVKILQAEGCDYLQGYYYSKPLEYAAFKQYCVEKLRNAI